MNMPIPGYVLRSAEDCPEICPECGQVWRGVYEDESTPTWNRPSVRKGWFRVCCDTEIDAAREQS